MKALTLHQPWASLAALGYKPDETRSWSTSHRGPLAIHASVAMPAEARAASEQPGISEFLARHGYTFDNLPRGGVVGTAHVADVLRTSAVAPDRTPEQLATGDYGPHRYAWLLEHAGPMPFLPCKGGQRIWNVPADLVHHFKLQVY